VKKLLYQFDTDTLPSVFDNVVAYDGGADHVCSYGGEFFLDALVAAVDVVHAVDDGFALGDERGQDE